MAKVTVTRAPAKAADAWDEISTVDLRLTREEAKVVYTLTGMVAAGDNGPAGEASKRVFHAIDDLDERLNEDDNLYVDSEPLVIRSR